MQIWVAKCDSPPGAQGNQAVTRPHHSVRRRVQLRVARHVVVQPHHQRVCSFVTVAAGQGLAAEARLSRRNSSLPPCSSHTRLQAAGSLAPTRCAHPQETLTHKAKVQVPEGHALHLRHRIDKRMRRGAATRVMEGSRLVPNPPEPLCSLSTCPTG